MLLHIVLSMTIIFFQITRLARHVKVKVAIIIHTLLHTITQKNCQ